MQRPTHIQLRFTFVYYFIPPVSFLLIFISALSCLVYCLLLLYSFCCSILLFCDDFILQVEQLSQSVPIPTTIANPELIQHSRLQIYNELINTRNQKKSIQCLWRFNWRVNGEEKKCDLSVFPVNVSGAILSCAIRVMCCYVYNK